MDKNDVLNLKEKLMEQLPLEIIWVNINSNIIYANAKFCETIGYH